MTVFVQKKAQGMILSTFFMFFIGQVYASDQVAVVVSVAGKASSGGRALTRKSPIYQGETINTDAGGKVSFKFTDGGLVSLAENSSYQIKNYTFHSGKTPDTFEAKLIKGGLKTVTGKIGKEAARSYEAAKAGIAKESQSQPANYILEAGGATIGARGTSGSVELKHAPEPFFGLSIFSNETEQESSLVTDISAYEGTFEVLANGDEFQVGDGADGFFAEISPSGSSYSSVDLASDLDVDDGGDDEDEDGDDEGDDEGGDRGGDRGGDEGGDDASSEGGSEGGDSGQSAE